MSIRFLAVATMVVGAILAAIGISMPLWSAEAFVDEQQVVEFTAAASAYHESISVPFADRDGTKLKAAQARFEAAKQAIHKARQRRSYLEKSLRIGGLFVLLAGGIVHLGCGKPTA